MRNAQRYWASPRAWLDSAGLFILASLIGFGFLALPASAGAAVRVAVDINAPPARILFDSEPQRLCIPGTRVYYVGGYDDADVYCFGPWWYAYRGGYWYRSNRWDGPWSGVVYRSVPREVVYVGPRYRHFAHVTPAEWRRQNGWRDREWREARKDERRDMREERKEQRREARRERPGRDHGAHGDD